ncbi:diacylglycerol/lipid kinase family protein [Portibacter lacus]|uniref:Diacylglycerol kinase n=1 Tax=Portibacter lacus TaxID=1099794 RepID=A0AA37WDL5_9BACT|nr:diacylglycerol kinase family protein [Portibacter lacus]GLR18026.1 diacylglycerol kinase [Portibacter lacus]
MNYLFIINPVSGTKKGEKIYRKVLPLFEKSNCNIIAVISAYAGHFYEIANSYNFNSIDSVVIIGGDGSMHEFVNGMLDRKDGKQIVIGLIPAGTGNSLVRDLDLLSPISAAEKILADSRMEMDVAKVSYDATHIYSINVIGWGLPSTINQKAEKLKRFGGQRYNVASLLEIIRNPNWPVRINVEDKVIEGDYSFFMACNTIHTGNGMKMAPKARLYDGLFDVLILKQASRLKLIGLFAKIFKGDHLNHPLVEYCPARQFSVAEVHSSILLVDGQIVGSTPFSAEVLKGAIEIYC